MLGSRTYFGRRIALVSAMALLACGCAGRAPARRSAGTEQRFATPRAAVDAVVSACRTDDEARLVAIFGEQAKPVIGTGDPAADRERCQKLVEAARQTTRLDPKGKDTVQFVVGPDDWAFPIPLVRDGKEWRFDTAEGMQEIRRRRVGADELEAITACRVYVAAQEEYAGRTRARVYAQKLASTSGRKDGLYWASTGKRGVSPLGAAAADAGVGTMRERGTPHGTWRGYRFRILTAQGSAVPGGKRSYVVGGAMTGGFALVAYPVAYGVTGVKTFVVASDGRVYEKDLGAETAAIGAAMTEYDPDGTWQLVGG